MPRARDGRASMRWIRSNIRGLARLALFSLVAQIIITFGHVHLDGRALASAQAAQSAVTDQAVAPLAKANNKGQKSHGAADVDCPICALIQLASTSAPSVAPPLPIPAILGGTILEAAEAPDFAASTAFAFQARGPPAI
jgi:hypothetical protein